MKNKLYILVVCYIINTTFGTEDNTFIDFLKCMTVLLSIGIPAGLIHSKYFPAPQDPNIVALNKKNEEIKKLIEENNRLKSLIEKSAHKEILEGASTSEESNKESKTEEEKNNSSKIDTPLFLPKKVNSLLYLFQLPKYNGTDVIPFRPIPIQKANTVIVASQMIQSWRYLKNKLSNINHEIRAEDLYFHCL